MQVVKIIVLFTLSMGILFLIGCTSKSLNAEQARAVNYQDYYSPIKSQAGINPDDADALGYNDYHLEDFLTACGAIAAFQEDGANITAECNGWVLDVETYQVPSGHSDPYWCTQVSLSKEDEPYVYTFGHVKGSMPRVVSQPEQIWVCGSGAHPRRQHIEQATFDDLVELMTSGNLWEDRDNPLDGLSFSYQKTDPSGKNIRRIWAEDLSDIPLEEK